jgi:hypothetical protein
MFEAEYIDVTLTKARNFADLGTSDTLRVFEPTASFTAKSYKDDEARQNAVINEMKKNTFVVIDGTAQEFDKKLNILDYISPKDGQRLQKAFGSFFIEDDENEESNDPK